MHTEFICLRIRTSGGLVEYGNEPMDSIKGWEFLNQQSDYWFSRPLLHGAS
jgi:hypothetical protein